MSDIFINRCPKFNGPRPRPTWTESETELLPSFLPSFPSKSTRNGQLLHV